MNSIKSKIVRIKKYLKAELWSSENNHELSTQNIRVSELYTGKVYEEPWYYGLDGQTLDSTN